jgi:hypothetical protein
MAQISIHQDVARDLAAQGFAWIPAARWAVPPEHELQLRQFSRDWDDLEPDRYLAGGATFRQRRYARYSWSPGDDDLELLPTAPYFQPIDENRYAGGVQREFAPLSTESQRNPFLTALIRCTFACLPISREQRDSTWEVRVHQIRILATDLEPGQPAPEGIHQDGTDFLTLHLIRRDNVTGGTTTIYDLRGEPMFEVTLLDRLDSLILDDPRVLHGVTTVRVADRGRPGTRDLLGIDFIHQPRAAALSRRQKTVRHASHP